MAEGMKIKINCENRQSLKRLKKRGEKDVKNKTDDRS